MATSSLLCQINGGCMGCCGHDYPSGQAIKVAIAKNTSEFLYENPKTREEFLAFRDRAYPSDLRDGVCRNLINTKGCFHCPLHPSLHKGEDLRIGHCDVNFLCKTAKAFEGWDEKKQKAFLDFIKAKKLSSVEFSLGMDKTKFLKEFEENY